MILHVIGHSNFCVHYIINGALIIRIVMTGTYCINKVGGPTCDKVWLTPTITKHSCLTNIKNLICQIQCSTALMPATRTI